MQFWHYGRDQGDRFLKALPKYCLTRFRVKTIPMVYFLKIFLTPLKGDDETIRDIFFFLWAAKLQFQPLGSHTLVVQLDRGIILIHFDVKNDFDHEKVTIR